MSCIDGPDQGRRLAGMGPIPCPRLCWLEATADPHTFFRLPKVTALDTRALVQVFNHSIKLCQQLQNLYFWPRYIPLKEKAKIILREIRMAITTQTHLIAFFVRLSYRKLIENLYCLDVRIITHEGLQAKKID